jgi:hypothetical protein
VTSGDNSFKNELVPAPCRVYNKHPTDTNTDYFSKNVKEGSDFAKTVNCNSFFDKKKGRLAQRN